MGGFIFQPGKPVCASHAAVDIWAEKIGGLPWTGVRLSALKPPALSSIPIPAVTANAFKEAGMQTIKSVPSHPPSKENF